MENKRARIFELLKNEYFVRWVQSPNKESVHYWSKWISNHPEQKKEAEIARRIIQSSKLQSDIKLAEEAYDCMLENIVNYDLKSKSKSRWLVSRYWRPISVAASIVLIVFASILGYRKTSVSDEIAAIMMVEKEAPFGRKLTTELPDGTIVNLNSGTKITFPNRFNKDTREVTLTGEAFFEVDHNPDKPFIVKMNGDMVRVLGTSFNIRSYPEDSVVQVSVATGRVAYTVPTGEEVVLAPTQMATYLPARGSLTTEKVEWLQAFGWKDRIMYFKSTPFDHVIQELERWYDVEIQAKGSFNEIGTFSGEFRNETLFQVLKGLSFVYQFEFKIEGKKVTLIKVST